VATGDVRVRSTSRRLRLCAARRWISAVPGSRALQRAGGLAEAEPALTDDIVFGAAACLHVDNRFAEYVLGRWDKQQSSLRDQRGLLPAAS
jgi:hypothetical protein